MDAYQSGAGRRANAHDIAGLFADRLGVTVMHGLSSVIQAGDAIVGPDRVAGFMETHDRREWYLPLSAHKALTWKSQVAPDRLLGKVGFLLSTGFGNGSPMPQPSGSWKLYVNERFAIAIRVVKHSKVWRHADCRFAFSANRIESAPPNASITLSSVLTDESFAAFGPALLVVPSAWIRPGEATVLRAEPVSDAASTRWFQIATTPGILDSSDVYGLVDQLESPTPQINGHRVFFGDIHTHSGQVGNELKNRGCGWGSREDNYAYARGPGGLDFYGLSDHEWQVDQDKTDSYFQLADGHNQDGEFVCLPGFEFTSLLYGHRNIYFKESGGPLVNASKPWGRPTKDAELSTRPEELWQALEASGADFISIPHHVSAASHPFNWATFNARHDRLVEIYSCWGSSEYYGDFPRGVSDRYRSLTARDALDRGCRIGFIASSDGHDGHPGNAQSPLVKHHHIFHHNGSGLVAVLIDRLTRHDVFSALEQRRCYATTGVPIRLWFDIDGSPMGTESAPLGKNGKPTLRVKCAGTNGIDHIRIVKNGRVVHTLWCHGEHETDLRWKDGEHDPARPAYYYIRVVQVDRESAWSSPIWIG